MPEDAAALRGAIDQKEGDEADNELDADDLARLDAVLGGKGLGEKGNGKIKTLDKDTDRQKGLFLDELNAEQIKEFFQGLANLGKEGGRSIAENVDTENIEGEGDSASLDQDLTQIAKLHTEEGEDPPKITTEDLNELPDKEADNYTSVMTQLANMKSKFEGEVATTVANGLENLRKQIVGAESEDEEVDEGADNPIDDLPNADFNTIDNVLSGIDQDSFNDLVKQLPTEFDIDNQNSTAIAEHFGTKFAAKYPDVFGDDGIVAGAIQSTNGNEIVFVDKEGNKISSADPTTKLTDTENDSPYGRTMSVQFSCPPGFVYTDGDTIEKGDQEYDVDGIYLIQDGERHLYDPVEGEIVNFKDIGENLSTVLDQAVKSQQITEAEKTKIENEAKDLIENITQAENEITAKMEEEGFTDNGNGTYSKDGKNYKITTNGLAEVQEDGSTTEVKDLGSGLDALASMVDKFLPYLTQLGLLRDKVTNPDDFDDEKQLKYNISRLEGQKLNGNEWNQDTKDFYLAHINTMPNTLKYAFLSSKDEDAIKILVDKGENVTEQDVISELQVKVEKTGSSSLTVGGDELTFESTVNTIDDTETCTLKVGSTSTPITSFPHMYKATDEKQYSITRSGTAPNYEYNATKIDNSEENPEETTETTTESAETTVSDLNFGFGEVGKVAYSENEIGSTITFTNDDTSTRVITLGTDEELPQKILAYSEENGVHYQQLSLSDGTLNIEKNTTSIQKITEGMLKGNYQFMGDIMFKQEIGEESSKKKVIVAIVDALDGITDQTEKNQASEKICNSLEEYFKNGEDINNKVLQEKGGNNSELSLGEEFGDTQIKAIEKNESNEILLTINDKQYVLPSNGPKEKEEEEE